MSRRTYALRWVAMMGLALCASTAHAQQASNTQWLDLSTSKQLMLPALGNPQRVNSLPMSLAVSPDRRWVVSLNAGYGTFESGYMQSLAVLDAHTGAVRDFPEPRTLLNTSQAFFAGITFSSDGTKVYASLASSTDLQGDGHKKTGNGIAVYAFSQGVLTPERFLSLPPVVLAPGRHSSLLSSDGHTVAPYPAAIAVVRGARDSILVAENLADSVVLVDAQTGLITRSFDLSVEENVPATYPIAVAATRDGKRAFVALWNASEVVELDLVKGTVSRRLSLMKPSAVSAPGSHPCALLLDEHAGLLYVALSNRDAVAAISVGAFKVRGYFDTRLPGQSYFGAEPGALAQNNGGTRLYAANLGSDAVAILDPRRLQAQGPGMVEPIGFVPTELMPMALASDGRKLYIASAKGTGTGANNRAQRPTEATKHLPMAKLKFTYGPTLLYGTLAQLDEAGIESDLPAATDVVLQSNRMKAAQETIQFAGGANPIQHVIYILKENRTYDQLFGDLAKDGKPVGNGDATLAMYGAEVTPNQHRLALQFGVLDNFFDSGEVSGDGHVWSNAAITTDYVQKTWQQYYRNEQRTYDYEGVVADGYPLVQHIPDVAEPSSGYLWTNFAAHGKTIYHFAEFISSVFCDDEKGLKRVTDPKLGAMPARVAHCANPTIKPGEAVPEEWGGGTNLWPWDIPRLADNIATKPELVGHFAPEAPDFNVRVPDQIRVNIFLRHFGQWTLDRAAGRDTMPNFVLLRLPDDHTGGTTIGGPTPKSSVADNDLAVGRVVEAISHSAYWNDTAIFIVEDDAQAGADHVDSHRSLGIVVSKYAPHPKDGQNAVVDSRFYSTVSMLRTMETLLQVPPMNNNDAFASLIFSLFAGPGDQPAFDADASNRENGLIYRANSATAPGAGLSGKMDFRHADRADSNLLNLILWRDAMGSRPPPAMLYIKHPKKDSDE
ncbi:MAG: bifunctional YncE family protein/alkaline phosphatase family protein [Steroidobacteraceae bacterium]